LQESSCRQIKYS